MIVLLTIRDRNSKPAAPVSERRSWRQGTMQCRRGDRVTSGPSFLL